MTMKCEVRFKEEELGTENISKTQQQTQQQQSKGLDFPESILLFYDIGLKIKRISDPNPKHPPELAHKSNLEEKEFKVIHKDKWPLPLSDINFTLVNPNNPHIWFGSTFPRLIIEKKPIVFDVSKCHCEMLHV